LLVLTDVNIFYSSTPVQIESESQLRGSDASLHDILQERVVAAHKPETNCIDSAEAT
jgi:hypothetical protein